MGEIKSTTNWKVSNGIDPFPGMNRPSAPRPTEWPFMLSILVWVISVVVLFHRAWEADQTPKRPKRSAG